MEKLLQHKIIFITGASSGIGEACATVLAELGADLILTARRVNRLKDLARSLSTRYGVNILPLKLDVRDGKAVESLVKDLPQEFKKIDVLINNAGLVLGVEKAHETPASDVDIMMDTNVKGVLNLIRGVVPGMVAHNAGQVINISSIAGHEAYPGGSIYCASKHAVNAITKSLRMDLVDTDLRICAISPGLVDTEFSMVRFNGDQAKAKAVYAGLESLVARDIAEAVLFTITRPLHVQIADMIILASKQASATLVYRDL